MIGNIGGTPGIIVPDKAADAPAHYEKGRQHRQPNSVGLALLLPPHSLHHTNNFTGVRVDDRHQLHVRERRENPRVMPAEMADANYTDT